MQCGMAGREKWNEVKLTHIYIYIYMYIYIYIGGN